MRRAVLARGTVVAGHRIESFVGRGGVTGLAGNTVTRLAYR